MIIKFNEKELQYVKDEFETLLTSDDEDVKTCRDNLCEEEIANIKYFLNSIDKVNTHEEENKLFIDTCYWELGMYCFADTDCTYGEVVGYCGTQYADLYKKLVLDKEE